MSDKQKYIGTTRVLETPSKALKFKLGPNAVQTDNLAPECVTSDKISSDFLSGLAETVSEMALELLSQKVITDKFGNKTNVSINQKLMTDTVNDIYSQLRDIKGEPPVGLYLTATPEYFIGEEGATVTITAISTVGIFEHIAFYLDDILIPGTETENVYRWQHTLSINDTVTIKCAATIMGTDYSAEKTIRHYDSFWLGAGKNYTEVMDLAHLIPVESESLRGAYDITCNENDHFFIILGKAFKDSYIRADLNGFEIPITASKITVGGNEYWVYTSDNTYHAGIYNIDING